ncbi:MAG: SDR family oxidoreductase [Acidisphaera sp.]|nr:SDR family oxidoreductase [Acidisphaera sp.]
MHALDNFALTGKAALVLGGSDGIGRQIALGMAQAGARVFPVGRSAAKVEAVAAELRATGQDSGGYAADLTRPEEMDRVFADAIAASGGLDILVNSQGITILKPAEEVTRADFDAILATNLTSVFFACTTAGRHMLGRGDGAIVNIASLAAERGMPLSSPYTVSKHGVLGLTRTLAIEWATRGVRVNAISPGFFMTALNREKMRPERKQAALRRTPMARFGELEELVGAAIYLASPAARFVTGQAIAVDGGFLAAGLD